MKDCKSIEEVKRSQSGQATVSTRAGEDCEKGLSDDYAPMMHRVNRIVAYHYIDFLRLSTAISSEQPRQDTNPINFFFMIHESSVENHCVYPCSPATEISVLICPALRKEEEIEELKYTKSKSDP